MSSFDTTLAGLGVQRTGSAATPTVAAVGSTQTLGQADFLKLLTAQLQNQDPFAPVDNTQMVAQMAQFSQLSGITDINSTLKALSDKLSGTSTADAMSYVGKTVLVPGDTAYGMTSGGLTGSVALGADASSVKVSISDANGNLLKTIDLGKQSQGRVDFDWDGKTATGEDAGTGPFKISAIANDGSKSVTTQTLVWAPVSSVSSPGSGSPVLNVAGVGAVDLSDVVEIG